MLEASVRALWGWIHHYARARDSSLQLRAGYIHCLGGINHINSNPGSSHAFKCKHEKKEQQNASQSIEEKAAGPAHPVVQVQRGAREPGLIGRVCRIVPVLVRPTPAHPTNETPYRSIRLKCEVARR